MGTKELALLTSLDLELFGTEAWRDDFVPSMPDPL